MTHEMAAGHHQGDSLAALISAKGKNNMNLDFIVGTHLRVWKKATDMTLSKCVFHVKTLWCAQLNLFAFENILLWSEANIEMLSSTRTSLFICNCLVSACDGSQLANARVLTAM